MKNKEKINQLKTDWFKTSTKIFDLRLDSYAISVFCYLSSCSEDYHPSIREIADKIGVNKNTVSRAIKNLIICNVLVRLSFGTSKNKKTSKFEVNNPDKWKKYE